jgi:cytosine permease
VGGVLTGDWIARWRGGQPALSTLTEKVRWQALVPYVLGCVVAWVSNEFGIGIAPLNGIVVALVGAWGLGVRASQRPLTTA